MKIDNVKCNEKSRKLRSVFWTSVNSRPIQTLIDTGSTVTAIASNTLKRFDSPIFKADIPPVSVEVANGSFEKAIEVVNLPITVGGMTFFHPTHVFKNLPFPLLLGDDFLEANQGQLVFNGSAAELTLIDSIENNINFIDEKGRVIETSFSERQTSDEKVFHHQTQNIEFPPKALHKVNLAPCEGMIDDFLYLVENSPQREDLLVMIPQLSAFSEGKLEIFVANPMDKSINTSLTLISSPVDTIEEPIIKSPKTQSCYKPYPLTDSQRNELDEILREFQDVLADKDDPLGQTDRVEHKIITEHEIPIRQKPYRLSPAQKETLEKELDSQLEKRIIQKSSSPWSSPIVMVPKGDGGTRVCIDYRKLNKITKKDAHPLPKIEEILDHLNGARIFSTLDLLTGYHQIPMEKASIPKTAFVTHKGLFEYLRMPMGLCNAAASFERLAEQVFALELWVFLLLYIDDVIIYSKSPSDHLKQLRVVLSRLRGNKLQAKLSKCRFAMSQLSFLGHTVNEKGILPLNSNTAAIKSFEYPKSQKDLRTFLGMCSYYRKFIPNFGKIAQSLYTLLKKEQKFFLTDEMKADFDTLKAKLSSPPLLHYPDYDKTFFVITDASKYAIGHIIAQEISGKFVPIRYGGRTLKPPEINYAISEKEALSLVHAIQKNHHYLYGRFFWVFTDHLPLRNMVDAHDPTGRLSRWHLTLQQYDYTVKYLPGNQNVVADALSRLNTISPEIDENEIPRKNLIDHERPQPVSCVMLPDPAIIGEQDKDPEIREIKLKLQNPSSPLHDNYVNDQSVLFRISPLNTMNGKRQLVVPRHRHHELIEQFHSPNHMAHFGISSTVNKLMERYYFKGLPKAVTHFINNCDDCNRHKGRTKKAPVFSIPFATPFNDLTCDVLGPFPPTINENRYIISFMDRYSSWPEAFAVKSIETATVARLLVEEVIFRFGTPRTFSTDQGTNFTSKLMNAVCQRLGIKKIESTPYHPQSNGFIERLNQVIVTGISHHVNAHHSNWDTLLPGVLFAHRTSVVRTRGRSPYELLFGRLPTLPPDVENLPSEVLTLDTNDYMQRLNSSLEHAKRIAIQEITKSKVKAENDAENENFIQYPVGSYVWLTSHKKQKGRSSKFLQKFSGPHEIIEVFPPVNYKLKTPNGKILKSLVHHDRIKPHNGDPPVAQSQDQEEEIEESDWEEEDDIPLAELQKRLKYEKDALAQDVKAKKNERRDE